MWDSSKVEAAAQDAVYAGPPLPMGRSLTYTVQWWDSQGKLYTQKNCYYKLCPRPPTCTTYHQVYPSEYRTKLLTPGTHVSPPSFSAPPSRRPGRARVRLIFVPRCQPQLQRLDVDWRKQQDAAHHSAYRKGAVSLSQCPCISSSPAIHIIIYARQPSRRSSSSRCRPTLWRTSPA